MKSCQTVSGVSVHIQRIHMKNETDDNTKQTVKTIESPQNQPFVEPATNPSGETKQNPQEIQKSYYSETFTEQVQNLSVELQDHFSESFSLEQTQAAKQSLGLQNKNKSELHVKY